MSGARHYRTANIGRRIEQDATLVQAAIDHLTNQLHNVTAWAVDVSYGTGSHTGATILVETETDEQPDIDPALAALMRPTEVIELDELNEGPTKEQIEVTTVEAKIIRADEIRSRQGYVVELVEALHACHRDLVNECQAIMRSSDRPPAHRPKCTGDRTHAGYLVALEDGGWHDPTCENDSRSLNGGLCNACRMRENRWRENNPKYEDKPLDEPPVEHESTHWIDDNGVAHIEPARAS